MPCELALRPAETGDADEIARVMRASLTSFDWMPIVHTPEEDRGFTAGLVLPNQKVTVAAADGGIVGFVAVAGEWVEQLYLLPQWTGKEIGTRLLDHATADMPVTQLYCFQANDGARRFYERHGFGAVSFSDGGRNEEGLPDILYVRAKRD